MPFDPPEEPQDTNTGGGGGGGGGGNQNYIAALKALLQQLGIPITGNINQLLQEAARKGYSQSTFLFYLRQTPEYLRAFAGIFDEDGNLKMSEFQYLAQKQQYADIAGLFGLRFSDRFAGILFENDVSVAEFRQRAGAERVLRDNRVTFQQFERVLRQRGLLKGQLTKKDLRDFVYGTADPAWYKVWRETQVRATAVQAGLNFGQGPKGKDLRLPRGALKALLQANLAGGDLAKAVEAIADNFLNTLPLAQIYDEGLSKKDIVTAIVGGKGSALLRQKLERLLATHEAFETEERAQSQLFATGTGTALLTGSPQQIATE
jgi:hypothetical protein